MLKNIMIITLISIFGCSSKQTLNSRTNAVVKEGVISVSADWIKNRKNKTDLQLRIVNLSREFLVIPFSDLGCTRGVSRGVASAALGGLGVPFFYNRHNQEALRAYASNELSLNPDEEKEIVVSCGFSKPSDGQFSLRIKNIYKRNPDTSKGKAALENIAKDVVWRPN